MFDQKELKGLRGATLEERGNISVLKIPREL